MRDLIEFDTRIDHRHDDVRENIPQDHQERSNGQRAHDHRLVPANDGLELQQTESLDVEHHLHQHAASHKDRHQMPEAGRDRDERIAECVPKTAFLKPTPLETAVLT